MTAPTDGPRCPWCNRIIAMPEDAPKGAEPGKGVCGKCQTEFMESHGFAATEPIGPAVEGRLFFRTRAQAVRR